MLGTTDYVISIGELIQEWRPNLEWDEIMDMVLAEDPIAVTAKKQIDMLIRAGLL